MDQPSVREVLTRIEEMRVSVTDFGSLLEEASFDPADRRYLSRCVELLKVELAAMRDYAERLI